MNVSYGSMYLFLRVGQEVTLCMGYTVTTEAQPLLLPSGSTIDPSGGTSLPLTMLRVLPLWVQLSGQWGVQR